ncbi:hypothetical protein EJ05DRAFT_253853 [Pseudovirgaria hyperparasitica]|uniref:Uncharacterized protein n=1 Tax=Pseudovirgaria hyperparasitica TaxID=470096 RepID=A0A6A6WF21_9PEZI|nr:uncharacterized protein EJ05DRAFT_253853 [Pseudovirgaria hyperparasitica]KAF2761135.1 hypothetical protein EJ05DRAFT_253853 [Pseudovirgaria hyperparasitica]
MYCVLGEYMHNARTYKSTHIRIQCVSTFFSAFRFVCRSSGKQSTLGMETKQKRRENTNLYIYSVSQPVNQSIHHHQHPTYVPSHPTKHTIASTPHHTPHHTPRPHPNPTQPPPNQPNQPKKMRPIPLSIPIANLMSILLLSALTASLPTTQSACAARVVRRYGIYAATGLELGLRSGAAGHVDEEDDGVVRANGGNGDGDGAR